MKTILFLGFIAAVTACGSHAHQTGSPALPAPNAQGEYTVGFPELGRGEERRIAIQLGPDTYARCRDVSPKFPFDGASTYAQDSAQLEALAGCLNHPSMKERNVMLIGRADPRGTADYNLELGAKRADHIRALLMKAGLAGDRIQMQSVGEQAAKGHLPEYSYGYDRRVDIVVTGGAHAP